MSGLCIKKKKHFAFPLNVYELFWKLNGVNPPVLFMCKDVLHGCLVDVGFDFEYDYDYLQQSIACVFGRLWFAVISQLGTTRGYYHWLWDSVERPQLPQQHWCKTWTNKSTPRRDFWNCLGTVLNYSYGSMWWEVQIRMAARVMVFQERQSGQIAPPRFFIQSPVSWRTMPL